MSSQVHLQTLVQSYTRQLQKLREKEALLGFDTPIVVQLQIETIEEKLQLLRDEIQNRAPDDQAAGAHKTRLIAEIEQELQTLQQSSDERSSTQTGSVTVRSGSGSHIQVGNVVTGSVTGNVRAEIGRAQPVGDDQAQLRSALTAWLKAVTAAIETAALDDDEQAFYRGQAEKAAAEAAAGSQADAGKLERWLNTLITMSPDMLDVTLATLQHPLRGVGLVLEKIRDRAVKVTQTQTR